jgi:REP element-mobilizing transposase RayT
MNQSLSYNYFFTWTVYGTFLPGDSRGWRNRDRGDQLPNPLLEQWHANRLKHKVKLLDVSERAVVENAVKEICEFRSWILWAVAARSNHVHVVVTAFDYKPTLAMNQLKSKATRELRRHCDTWRERPVWSAKGDREFLNSEDEIDQCVVYVLEAQDRKGERRN